MNILWIGRKHVVVPLLSVTIPRFNNLKQLWYILGSLSYQRLYGHNKCACKSHCFLISGVHCSIHEALFWPFGNSLLEAGWWVWVSRSKIWALQWWSQYMLSGSSFQVHSNKEASTPWLVFVPSVLTWLAAKMRWEQRLSMPISQTHNVVFWFAL